MRCNHNENAQMIDILDTKNKYYLSLNAKNKMGVIGSLGKICEENNISVACMLQRGLKNNNTADIILITELCYEKDIRHAIEQFEQSEAISQVNSLIRVQYND